MGGLNRKHHQLDYLTSNIKIKDLVLQVLESNDVLLEKNEASSLKTCPIGNII